MLKYLNGVILSKEIPNETTLFINISEETGTPLLKNLSEILKEYGRYITCFGLKGEVLDQRELLDIYKAVHKNGIRTYLSTNLNELSKVNLNLLNELNYIRLSYKDLLIKDFDPFEDTETWYTI